MLRIDFNLVLTIINLIVLYLILRKFLFRPVMDIMEKREKMIADGISHANEEQDKAHALKKQYEDALNGAKEESTKMIEQAKLDAKQEYNQILNEANEKADKVMKTARESLNQEREQAFDDMKAQVAGLAMDAAKVLNELGISKEAVLEAGNIFEKSQELKAALVNPVITKETKHNIIDKVFSEEMRTFLKVVCDHEKMTIAEQIFAAYEELQNQAAGVKTVYLRYTALPSEEQKKQMGDFIKKKYGAGDIKWVMAEDKALIGGFILQVDGKEYDYSVQGRLNRLERKLTN